MSMDQDIALPNPIRWLVRRDMPQVIVIAQQCYDDPWDLDQFTTALKQRNCIGMVHQGLNHDDPIKAYMLYELAKSKLSIINFGVGLPFRRQKVGTEMLSRLIEKLHTQRRTRLEIDVPEQYIGAHFFLRANGFTAVSVNRDQFDGNDGYRFIYDIDKPLDDRLPPQNELIEV